MDLCLINYGMQSPNGTDVSMSIANVLAGIARVSKLKNIKDMRFNPVSLGIAKYINADHTNSERFIELLKPVFKETTQVLNDKFISSSFIKIIVGLPKKRPGLDERIINELKELLSEFGDSVKFEIKTEFIREDHSSGMLALEKAKKEIENGDYEFCLVAGVDSFVSKETIEWLEKDNQLKCSTNKNGYIPGEAASCLLLCDEVTATRYELPVKAIILDVASSEELAFAGSGIPTTGKGLSAAINTVLKSLPEGEKVSETFCTLNGLRLEMEEFGYSNMVSGPFLHKPGEFSTFASCWGNVGAASATSLICYAVEKNVLGFSEGPNSLIFTISPGKSRSAALIKTLSSF